MAKMIWLVCSEPPCLLMVVQAYLRGQSGLVIFCLLAATLFVAVSGIIFSATSKAANLNTDRH